jgi:dihydroxycyclohexadiene carboxylate dehydrogenase
VGEGVAAGLPGDSERTCTGDGLADPVAGQARCHDRANKEATMNARFQGQVALVTGAAQGIGRGVCWRLKAEGAQVIAVDRSEWVHELAGEGMLTLTADLEQHSECARVMAQAVETFGRLDILVNNVGGTIWAKPFEHYEVEQIEAEVRRSLFPTLWCCHAALPYMLERNSGAIVNVSSIATRGVNRVPYGAAKGGVNALTACLAFETAGRGIRVNATAPGGTEAPPRRVPRNDAEQSEQDKAWYQQIVAQTLDSSLMKRYGSIDEQVSAILFLASDEASYITGVTLPVGGGDLG